MEQILFLLYRESSIKLILVPDTKLHSEAGFI